MFGAAAILGLVNSIVSGISGYFHDKSAEAQARLAIEAALVEFMRQVDTGQIELNKEEAKSASLFVAGWRPFIGWCGGLGIAYQFLIRPLVDAISYLIDPNFSALPSADLNELIGLVSAMLGVAGLRSWEKIKGV
jgi:hypothetical protein